MISKKGIVWCAAACLSLVLSGCQTTAEQPEKGEEYSGFLTDYSLLGQTVAQDSFAVKRWVNPKLYSGEYAELEYVSTQYYPDIRPNDQVSDETLTDILIYVDGQLRLASLFISQDMSDKGTKKARVRAAITAVETLNKDYESHEVVSQALISAAEATSVNPRNDDAVIAFELEARDVETGELLVQSVVTGVAPTVVVNGQERLSLTLLKPTIDRWIEFATNSGRKLAEQ
ncbi:DUF3313 domain-containing protein [Litoribacillus peritrichatus]|uniref:DUF3313 domain-containing protein n=1 Tax=Litoribacillus peritrichatus TaxID=718191 RepID=A0ABP7NDL9_9GAMM